MNPVFKTLTKAILENVEDQLANNEDAHDGELWDFMVDELGLSPPIFVGERRRGARVMQEMVTAKGFAAAERAEKRTD
ncbi:hypothetical protein [Pseudomonas coronafaciens]|uniref:hypothetical protein n=1 Tax=Pseudomonas coronafaciens TaxID=53409 RepID=UPI000EFF2487|nr:hypothetical protein [Pseudomonas coronafaciens]QIQ70802.1 hypothetical protein HBB04_01162 [Pseudomonas coronafaciens]RMP29740.1 hypothetical protein ALQ25_200152 [Pseudomonas coronafaciens pv. atropurpurea]